MTGSPLDACRDVIDDRAFEFVRIERAPKHGLTTIHVEEPAGDVHAGDWRAAVASPQRGRDRHRGRDRIERIVPGDPVDDIARGRPLAEAILGDVRLPHHDQPIRLIVGERPEQHRVDEREERGRGRDAESEEERDADRHSGSSDERPQCLCDVMPGAAEDEIPDQREPGRRQGEAPLGVRRGEQALTVVADGMPLPAVANAQYPEQPA